MTNTTMALDESQRIILISDMLDELPMRIDMLAKRVSSSVIQKKPMNTENRPATSPTTKARRGRRPSMAHSHGIQATNESHQRSTSGAQIHIRLPHRADAAMRFHASSVRIHRFGLAGWSPAPDSAAVSLVSAMRKKEY